MTTHTNCPHCHAPTPKTPHRVARGAVVGLAWTVSMFFVFAGILLGPAIIFVLPLLIPMGIGAITAAHAWAYGDRACEACGKLYELDGRPVQGEASTLRAEPELLAA